MQYVKSGGILVEWIDCGVQAKRGEPSEELLKKRYPSATNIQMRQRFLCIRENQWKAVVANVTDDLRILTNKLIGASVDTESDKEFLASKTSADKYCASIQWQFREIDKERNALQRILQTMSDTRQHGSGSDKSRTDLNPSSSETKRNSQPPSKEYEECEVVIKGKGSQITTPRILLSQTSHELKPRTGTKRKLQQTPEEDECIDSQMLNTPPGILAQSRNETNSSTGKKHREKPLSIDDDESWILSSQIVEQSTKAQLEPAQPTTASRHSGIFALDYIPDKTSSSTAALSPNKPRVLEIALKPTQPYPADAPFRCKGKWKHNGKNIFHFVLHDAKGIQVSGTDFFIPASHFEGGTRHPEINLWRTKSHAKKDASSHSKSNKASSSTASPPSGSTPISSSTPKPAAQPLNQRRAGLSTSSSSDSESSESSDCSLSGDPSNHRASEPSGRDIPNPFEH